MSTKGIYTALSGARAQSQRLDTIANNIANANTTGYKKDAQVFKEYLTAHQKQSDVIEVPKVPSSVESFYDMKSADKAYVDTDGSYTDFQQGALKPTGNPLDLAIYGKGFFEVLTPAGVRMTRAGSLSLDGQGRLVTKQGYPVLSEGATQSDPLQRVMTLRGGTVNVSLDGQLSEEGQRVGKLSLVNVENEDALRKMGSSLYAIKENYTAQFNYQPEIEVKQGFLEASNVNIVKEMTDMISATRSFEATQKAMKAYDQMNEKLVNVVPKLNL